MYRWYCSFNYLFKCAIDLWIGSVLRVFSVIALLNLKQARSGDLFATGCSFLVFSGWGCRFGDDWIMTMRIRIISVSIRTGHDSTSATNVIPVGPPPNGPTVTRVISPPYDRTAAPLKTMMRTVAKRPTIPDSPARFMMGQLRKTSSSIHPRGSVGTLSITC